VRTLTLQKLDSMRGKPVFDARGERIGQIEEIFVDTATREAEWIEVGAGGFFGKKHVLVPVEEAREDRDGVKVAFDKDRVKNAPELDTDQPTQQAEAELYRYYGLGFSHEESPSQLPDERATAQNEAGTADRQSVTRSEEELRVGKREVSAGHVRLRKYVVTEPVSAEVELRSERLVIETEPVAQAPGTADISDAELDMELRREEPVVQKDTVAKEQITARVETETERRQISDEVRKEKVDVEDDEARRQD